MKKFKLVILFLLLIQTFYTFSNDIDKESKTVKFKVIYYLNKINEDNKIEIKIPLISNYQYRQIILETEYSIEPTKTEIINDNTYVVFNLIKNQLRTIEITYIIKIFDYDFSKLDQSTFFYSYDYPDNIKIYLEEEDLIESNHELIVERGKKLRKKNEITTVKRIYNFVLKRLRYRLQSEEHGALFGYKNKFGDCTEYSALLAALCRTNGIPARQVYGYIIKNYDEIEKEIKYGHAWTEIYLMGYGWVHFDPTFDDFQGFININGIIINFDDGTKFGDLNNCYVYEYFSNKNNDYIIVNGEKNNNIGRSYIIFQKY